MASLTDDLQHSAKLLDDAELMTRNAATLLNRVSGSLAEDVMIAARILEESQDHVHRTLTNLDSP